MEKFLLGFLAGAAATAVYMNRQGRDRAGSEATSPLTVGRVDELSSAANDADTPAVDASDGTPNQGSPRPEGAVRPPAGSLH